MGCQVYNNNFYSRNTINNNLLKGIGLFIRVSNGYNEWCHMIVAETHSQPLLTSVL